MRFKIGDKVKVKEDLVSSKYYGDYVFSPSMEEYKGEIVEIGKF